MTELFTRTVLGSALGIFMAVFAAGCDGGDTGSGGSGGTGATGGGGSGGSGATGGGGSGGSGGATGGGGSGGGASAEYAMLVRAPLFTDDLAAAQQKHDGIAQGGESAAKAAGDIAHHVLLGTALLGTTENEFLAMDRWNDAMAMGEFYQNPDIQMAFGELFGGPPVAEPFMRQPTWHTWGDITSGADFDPYYWVIVRGKLKEADPAKAQAAHDMLAAGGEQMVQAAGDVAHIVFTGLQDPQEFLAVDIWKSTDNMEAVYTDPNFVMAFSGLFEGQPTLHVYQSTTWHQW